MYEDDNSRFQDHDKIPRLHEDCLAIREYARRPVPRSADQQPYTPYEVDTFSGASAVPTATVLPLKPPQAASLQDEILQILDTLVADIRSGKVTPLHLILSFADDRPESVVYDWHGIGLSRFEMIGQLTAEATMLAMEDE